MYSLKYILDKIKKDRLEAKNNDELQKILDFVLWIERKRFWDSNDFTQIEWTYFDLIENAKKLKDNKSIAKLIWEFHEIHMKWDLFKDFDEQMKFQRAIVKEIKEIYNEVKESNKGGSND